MPQLLGDAFHKLWESQKQEEAQANLTAQQKLQDRLDGLACDETAKLVSWMADSVVRKKYEAVGIEFWDGVGSELNYWVLIGTEDAWNAVWELGIPGYWTAAFYEGGRWVEKKRKDRPRSQWTISRPYDYWCRKVAAEREDLFSTDFWANLHGRFPDEHDEDKLVALEVEGILSVTRDPDQIAARLSDMSACRVEVFDTYCIDLRTDRRWNYEEWGK